jgi:long-chain acyl-CoA synthetase
VDDKGSLFIRGRSKTMILGASGQNIYPEEIEARLNTLPLVSESLVVDEKGRLIALVHPDLEEATRLGLEATALAEQMERNRLDLNRQLPEYGRIASITLRSEQFEKTPTNKIKRFLYSAGC